MRPFTQLSGRDKAVEVLRWLLVPVAALAMVFLPTLVMRVAMPPPMAPHIGQPRPGPDPIRISIGRVARILMGAAFVFFGAMMAPRMRVGTALVLAGLWITYAALSHIVVHLEASPHYLDFSLAAGAAVLGALLIAYQRPKGAFAFVDPIRHD
jgi:hypothetical protein